MTTPSLPVAVIGAGPVGLAAAVHLVAAGETPIVFEAGDAVGASVRGWSHVRIFSPWQYTVDRVARGMLEEAGWVMPEPDAYPTGGEIVARYLEPLARLPRIAPHIRLRWRVVAVTRSGADKMKTAGRDDAPFLLQVERDGAVEHVLASTVIDASGTWTTPNPLGASSVPAIGEREAADRITYGIPDVLGTQRTRYAGKRVLVAGSGHSAFNVLADLMVLAGEAPGTEIVWSFRRQLSSQLFGGGEADQLPERGRLGERVKRLVDGGAIQVFAGFQAARVTRTAGGLIVAGDDVTLPEVDEIVVATGFRPDLAMLSELRLAFDPAVEAPVALAPLIDPNVHSCGSVRPHGAEELRHPEADFYVAGMKSYGRAPTFLMLTGYEQVRSIVAAIRGDWESARDVQLVLPETGVCSSGLVAATVAAPADQPVSVSVCCG